MKKVVCFGDFIVRINTCDQYKFMQTNQCEINYTGAEANVCCNLSQFGMKTEFVTRLPQNMIADAAVATLKKNGVSTEFIARGGARMGLFYVEPGADIRQSKVVYDRLGSGFTEATCSDFDWETILENAGALVLSSITMALSGNLRDICFAAAKVAKKKGVTVYLDVNYRSKLWTVEAAKATIEEFLPYVDVLVTNEEHAQLLLGIQSDIGEEDYEKRLEDKSKQIAERYNIPNVVITVRRTLSADRYKIWASCYRQNEFAMSRVYNLCAVDRIGSGDALTSGVVYALCNGFDTRKLIDFAVAACAIKHTVRNDVNYVELQDVYNLMDEGRLEISR
ncbi:MAG: sugar kinase [Ruminococcaceae bacterium]|nr:sugar kinase [Oscillospiraceae bacterium]